MNDMILGLTQASMSQVLFALHPVAGGELQAEEILVSGCAGLGTGAVGGSMPKGPRATKAMITRSPVGALPGSLSSICVANRP